MPGLLAGKRLLITGVITKDSMAFHVAQRAQAEGAEIVLTSFGRVRRLTERAAARLGISKRTLQRRRRFLWAACAQQLHCILHRMQESFIEFHYLSHWLLLLLIRQHHKRYHYLIRPASAAFTAGDA